RQVLADADAGGAGGDRLELAADAVGGVGLEVEAVKLRQAAGEEDVDGGPRRVARRGGGAEGGEVVHAEAEQADGTGLEGGAAGEGGVPERLGGGTCRSHGAPLNGSENAGPDPARTVTESVLSGQRKSRPPNAAFHLSGGTARGGAAQRWRVQSRAPGASPRRPPRRLPSPPTPATPPRDTTPPGAP